MYGKPEKTGWEAGSPRWREMREIVRCIIFTLSPGGEGTPLYKLYRYVWCQRVWFLSLFGLKKGIDFDHFGLK